MYIKNLTPHDVTIYLGKGRSVTFPAFGKDKTSRLNEQATLIDNIDGIDVYEVVYGEPDWLPEPERGVIYIVSSMVKDACPNRTDLYCPYGLIRDEKGNIIGAKGLRR